jgi:hypothetical protein
MSSCPRFCSCHGTQLTGQKLDSWRYIMADRLSRLSIVVRWNGDVAFFLLHVANTRSGSSREMQLCTVCTQDARSMYEELSTRESWDADIQST